MSRLSQRNSPTENMPTIVLLAHIGSAGDVKEYNFIDGSYRYYEKILKSAFKYTLIDNLGSGIIRITYNKPSLDIMNYTDGAKTLKPGDSIYLEDLIWHIKIYFIEDSTVEMVLKSDKME